MLLYRSLVRPLLEYGNPAWTPLLRSEEDALERVQRLATRLLFGRPLASLPYDQRLRALRLPTLAFRRLRGDMIETFKYTHNISEQVRDLLPMEVNIRTRGHNYKLKKPRANTNIRSKFFSNRVVNTWNQLPNSVVSAESTNSFKFRLDRVWEEHPLFYNYKAWRG